MATPDRQLPDSLSLKDAYLAAYYLIERYSERFHHSDEGVVLLVAYMHPLPNRYNDTEIASADPQYWEEWEIAVEKALREGLPPSR